MAETEVRSINGREISDNYSRNQLLNKIDKSKLNDNGTGVDELWSASKVNAQFNNIKDINIMVQSPLPQKQGILTNTNKLVIKSGDGYFNVIQKTNLGYLRYVFDKANGDTSLASVGGTWDLIRLKRVKHMTECLVWYEPSVLSGTVTTSITPATFNTVDNKFAISCDNTVLNSNNVVGLGLYTISANSSVEYTFNTCNNRKASLTYLVQANRSENIQIYVNNVKVQEFTCQQGFDGIYQTVEFDVPNMINTTSTYTVKITNASATNTFSYVAFNLMTLEKYDNRLINSYKVFGNSKEWINAVGASDYAIEDLDLEKWCGSYHGGETSLYAKCDWCNFNYLNNSSLYKSTDISTITTGAWTVLPNFSIRQQTNINNKAIMTSKFDFNTDGTLNMIFGLDENHINAKNIYTALTCTNSSFQFLSYPNIKAINLTSNTNISLQNGYIIQYDSTNKIELGIRFTMFNNFYNTLGTYITNNTNYSKFYYGIVTNYSTGINIPSLTFAKALDFNILEI